MNFKLNGKDEKKHLIAGEFRTSFDLAIDFDYASLTERSLQNKRFSLSALLDLLDRFSQEIASAARKSDQSLEQRALLEEVAIFCQRSNLKSKIDRAFVAPEFDDLIRLERNGPFEGWRPLGLVFHITPSNALNVPFLSFIEGLLTGNINIIKLTEKNAPHSLSLFSKLLTLDRACLDIVAHKLYALTFSQRDKTTFNHLVQLCDGVALWGGDDVATEVKKIAHPHTRVIVWGHKISFAYIAKSKLSDKTTMQQLAYDSLLDDQQACSSPQVVYAEVESFAQLKDFAITFSHFLNEEIDKKAEGKIEWPSLQEQAEITNVVELLKLESLIKESMVLEDEKKRWRILVENNGTLKASPLFRTIWVRPLLRTKILQTLIPHRHYLQTVGLSAGQQEIEILAKYFFAAGATRITALGSMLNSYISEPHDGEISLLRFLKRVSLSNPQLDCFSLSELENKNGQQTSHLDTPVMNKEMFQKNNDFNRAHLFFKSGGSSGKSALSTFSYADYNRSMEEAAYGLLAAGVDPQRDRVINLFHGGGLYGGLLSFFTILEKIKCPQFPMAAHEDMAMVANSIVDYEVNTLMGMPTYIWQLLTSNVEKFKKYGGIKKIFFGGEHFSNKQRQWISSHLGITHIRSASYGSVDAGPIGFQCQFCGDNEYHIHQKLLALEVLHIENDSPVSPDQVGRLVLTSKERETNPFSRYDIGDLVKIVNGNCPCGRQTVRLQLLGRTGDVFRAGGTFYNYAKFQKILEETAEYTGKLQIVLEKKNNLDFITLKIEKSPLNCEKMAESLLQHYPDLYEGIKKERGLELKISKTFENDFIFATSSKKLVRVLDKR